jgi:transcriptional repressor NrdR
VADFREELDRLEHELPASESQLPLIGSSVVPIDKNRKR